MAAKATTPRTRTTRASRRLQPVPDTDTAAASAGANGPIPGPYLAHLDPRDLLNHPGNVRRDLGDLTELRASIAAQGVLQALTVVPAGSDEFRVVFGHRRAAAAAEALDAGQWPAGQPATVPCLVRPDLVGLDVEQIVGMLTENDQRIEMKPSERAAGYAQLALFGLDPAEIARRTGRPLPLVRTTLTLHRLGEKVTAAADRGTVTLEEVAELETFDDKAIARILQHVDTPWGIRHRLATEKRKRQQKTDADRLTEELATAGVLVVKRPKGWPYDCPEAKVTDLRTADGQLIHPKEVQAREGFAAFLEAGYGHVEATIICLDPDQHGYHRVAYTRYQSPEQYAAEIAQAHAADERRAALGDAQDVRERFLAERYGSAKGAKTLLVDVLRATVDEPQCLDDGDAELVRTLARGDIAATGGAGLDRLHRLLVAMWIAAQETNLVDAATGIGLRSKAPRAVAWLDRLVAAGFELSPAETDLQAQLLQATAGEENEDAEKGEPGADEDDTDAVAPTANGDLAEPAHTTA